MHRVYLHRLFVASINQLIRSGLSQDYTPVGIETSSSKCRVRDEQDDEWNSIAPAKLRDTRRYFYSNYYST